MELELRLMYSVQFSAYCFENECWSLGVEECMFELKQWRMCKDKNCCSWYSNVLWNDKISKHKMIVRKNACELAGDVSERCWGVGRGWICWRNFDAKCPVFNERIFQVGSWKTSWSWNGAAVSGMIFGWKILADDCVDGIWNCWRRKFSLWMTENLTLIWDSGVRSWRRCRAFKIAIWSWIRWINKFEWWFY